MSKKIYLLLFSLIFIFESLNLNAMAADANLITEAEANNTVQNQLQLQTELLRVEKPDNFKERRVGTSPTTLFLDSDGKYTGISVAIPQVNLNISVPKDAKVTELRRSGFMGVKIELADGKLVNVLLPDLNTYSAQLAKPIMPRNENDAPQVAAMQTLFIVEKMQKNMDQMGKLNELFEKYANNLTLVKNDPEFKEIKPILKETYSMISSIPFFLSLGGQEIEMLKAKILEDMSKNADLEGFEDLNQDVREFVDHTFIYGDKFLEFLNKFSKDFADNIIIKELLAD